MIKNILLTIVLVFVLGNLCRLGMPWWALMPLAAIAAWIFPQPGYWAFASGFIAGAALWGINAYLIDAANDSNFSAKIGQVFQGASSAKIWYATTLMGGLLGGFGALTGHYAKEMFSKPSQKDYYGRRKRNGKFR